MIQSRNDLFLRERDRESLLARGPAAVHRDSKRWSAFDQAAGFFLLGLIYALILSWFGFRLGAAENDPAFFLITCLPGLLLWPAAGALLAFAHRPRGRWLCPAIVILQYLLTLDILTSSPHAEGRHLARAWTVARVGVLAIVAIFLIGQAALWGVYFIKRREAVGRGNPSCRITIAGAITAVIVLALLAAIVAVPARLIVVQQSALQEE